ncbi:MAG: hypothetical protein WA790_15900 [Sulfitobacter sp.]
MTKETTVTFGKKHIYGGHTFFEGDKLTLPASKAKALKSAGALKVDKKSND